MEAVKVKFYCFLGIVHPTVYNTVGEPDYYRPNIEIYDIPIFDLIWVFMNSGCVLGNIEQKIFIKKDYRGGPAQFQGVPCKT